MSDKSISPLSSSPVPTAYPIAITVVSKLPSISDVLVVTSFLGRILGNLGIDKDGVVVGGRGDSSPKDVVLSAGCCSQREEEDPVVRGDDTELVLESCIYSSKNNKLLSKCS